LLACAIGVVLVRWLQSIEGVGMMWVFLSAVSLQAGGVETTVVAVNCSTHQSEAVPFLGRLVT
jgi:hypothetical protein